MLATYTFMEQSRQNNVPPRLDMVTFRTMRINWKVIHIVLKFFPYFDLHVAALNFVTTKKDNLSREEAALYVDDMDFFMQIPKSAVAQLAEQIHDQIHDMVVGNSTKPPKGEFHMKDVADITQIVRRYFPNGSSVSNWAHHLRAAAQGGAAVRTRSPGRSRGGRDRLQRGDVPHPQGVHRPTGPSRHEVRGRECLLC